MTDILLAPDVVVELATLSADAWQNHALKQRPGRLWAWAGATDYVWRQLSQKLGSTEAAGAALQEFRPTVNWQSALSGDSDCGSQSPLQYGLGRAVARLGDDAVLLTRDTDWLQNIAQASTPEQLLAEPAADPALGFLDLKTQQDLLRDDLEERMARVLNHGQYILGNEVKELESRLAESLNVEHCIGVSSGTDSLVIALMALGVGPGDEVITVPYTWISSAESVLLVGAKPVFVDIDPDTYNMDPAQLEAAITPRTKAIMPVSLYGQCADMPAINEVAARHQLPVIEDGAQSLGATCQGQPSCGMSTVGSTSFFPTKPLGGYGDGGALFTNDGELAGRMKQIRAHGQLKKHHHPMVGMNGRLDTLQAAILLSKLNVFEQECRQRAHVASRYDRLLRQQLPAVATPVIADGHTSVYAQYTIRLDNRDAVQAELRTLGIPSVAYYIVPLTLQPVMSHLGHHRGDFPVTERIADQCLSLPMSPYLTAHEQERIVAGLTQAIQTVGGSSAAAA